MALRFLVVLSLLGTDVRAHLIHASSSVPTATNSSVPTATNSSAPLDLNPEQPDFSSFNLYSYLNSPSSTLTALSTLPPNCASYTTSTSSGPAECTAGMTAMNITFDDCGDAFTVCRCADANMTMDVVTDRFARVPVGLRRYVGTVVVLADVTAHAYTLTSGDIHMFADCQMDTWVHEATHAFDFASPTSHSGSEAWSTAIASDSCVPDDYSLTDAIEDFAQVSVLKIYSLLANGTLPPGWSADCMSHQLEYMSSLPLYNPTTLFGATCAIEGGDPGARHTTPPLTLNASLTFSPMASVPTAKPTSTTLASSGFITRLFTPIVTPTATPSAPKKPHSGSISVSPSYLSWAGVVIGIWAVCASA